MKFNIKLHKTKKATHAAHWNNLKQTEFLDVLNVKKSTFAVFIDIDQLNLNMYFRSERRFNTELTLKFSHFFHTSAEVWLQIQLKNEMLELEKEQASDKYQK